MIEKTVKNLVEQHPRKIIFSSGLLSALAFAPFNLMIILFLCLPIFYLIISNSINHKKAFVNGLIFGYGFFLAGIYWIAISLLVDVKRFAWLIPFALTIIPGFLALYFGVLASLFYLIVNRFKIIFSYQKIILLAILWVIIEMMRSTLFSGFAWNLLGYSALFSIAFSQIASLFGVYFLSFFIVLIALTPLYFFEKKLNKIDKIFLVILSIFAITNFGYGLVKLSSNTITDSLKPITIRIVQANINQEMKWDQQQKYQNLIKHIDLTRSKSLENIDAVVWSESSVPYIIEDNDQLLKILKLATSKNSILITGALRVERNHNQEIEKIFNSVFVIDNNSVSDSYDKHHLVPFGEYVPLQKFLSFLFIDNIVDKITAGGMGFSSGLGAKTINTNKFSFNPLICYEVIFSSEIINKNQKPDLFINVTNDAWFKNSSGPYQHLASAQMRSIEYSIPMIRVAGTGVSAGIDSYGRIVDKIALNQEGVSDVKLFKNQYKSFYHQYGNYPLLLIMGILLLIVFKDKIKKILANR
jgi:apolipoprotein N-acyltransferase